MLLRCTIKILSMCIVTYLKLVSFYLYFHTTFLSSKFNVFKIISFLKVCFGDYILYILVYIEINLKYNLSQSLIVMSCPSREVGDFSLSD